MFSPLATVEVAGVGFIVPRCRPFAFVDSCSLRPAIWDLQHSYDRPFHSSPYMALLSSSNQRLRMWWRRSITCKVRMRRNTECR